MQYRPDIDGLRAVAVSSVVLGHAHVPGFAGGYVGVDVFFVISGVLITRLIVDDLDRGTFSFADFYERRVRRILPALIVMLAVTMAMGWFLLMPDEYRSLGRNTIAVLLFVSNFAFWRDVGYFAPAASEMPLLHTWSLAVEEQFYLVFPVLLLVLARTWPKQRMLVIAGLAVASFTAAEVCLQVYPRAAFYVSPMRMWELLAGSLLALGGSTVTLSTLAANGMALLGIAGVLSPLFLYSDTTPFPALAALPPVLGAVAVMLAGATRNNAVSKLLSIGPVVYLGRISYSLYLWHFPLLAFAAYASTTRVPLVMALGIVCVAVAIASLSYHLVETPYRNRRLLTRQSVFALAGAACAMAGAFAALAFLGDGLPGRFTGAAAAALVAQGDYNADRYDCFARERSRTTVATGCPIGETGQPLGFALWGDSHAEALRSGFAEVAKEMSIAGVYLGADGCPALMGLSHSREAYCAEVNDEILASLTAAGSPKTVILAARWPLWVQGISYGAEPRAPIHFKRPDHDEVENAAAQVALIESALRDTVARLQAAGKVVVLIGPVPEMGNDVPRAYFFGRANQSSGGGIPRKDFDERAASSIALLERVAAVQGTALIYPHTALCNATRCRSVIDGKIVYHDDDHLSRTGSRLLAPVLAAALADNQHASKTAP